MSSEIGESRKTDTVTVIEKPVAKFSALDSENEPLTVEFTDESTGKPDEWYWDFGDGET